MGTCTSSNATAPSTKSPVKRGSIKNESDNQQSRIPNDRNSGGRRAGALAPPGFVDISKSRIKDLGQLQIGGPSLAQSDATMSTNPGNYSPSKGENGDGRLSEPGDYEQGPPRDSLTKSRKPVFRPDSGSGVEWQNLSIEENKKAEDAVIGHGSFGVVIRARLLQQGIEVRIDENTLETTEVSIKQHTDVAVKVLTRAQNSLVTEKEFQKMCDKAFQEVHVLQEAESRMLYRDCIIRTFGIARGQLPDHITSILGMRSGVEGVGIVMKFEGGGSLEAYLSRQRSMGDKLRVLEGIARGLTELHGLGIIHSDIKPENILLSTDKPPEVRLADFGLSVFRNDKRLSKSSLVQTTHSRGTPIYFAPEMLMNPYQVTQKKVIAQSSRKTDVYAFALLAWEVLSQNQAFFDVDTEGELCAKVHQGQRPPIEQLPKNTPTGVVAMIKSCWDTNRQRRHTAVECLCTFQFYYGVYSKKKFDVFYSHSPKKNPISLFLLQHLIRLGYRVWFDQDDSDAMTTSRQNALLDGIQRSTVLVSFCDRAYQENMKCMFELKEARTHVPPKPIIVMASESDPLSYGTKLFLDLTQIRTQPFADISAITTELFDAEDVPSGDKLVSLQQMLQPVMQLLKAAGCRPSLDVLGKITD